MICFLHNPKTAGGSLINLIRDNYDRMEIYSIHSNVLSDIKVELEKLTEERKKILKLVYGHIEFGVHDFFPGQQVRYFMFLRDPVKRIISHYNFAKSRPDHYLHDIIHKNNMSLEDYVSSGIGLELNNGQVRLITAQFDPKKIPAIAEYGTNDTHLLDEAVANIEKYFDFIGIQEHFDESISYLSNMYGWKKKKELKINLGDYSNISVSPKEIAVIEKYNILDIQLYQYGIAHFSKTITQNPVPPPPDFSFMKMLSFFSKK
jgi:hypothetical protein